MGVLVQLEGTRFYRLALLPIVLWLAWRGAFVDLSGGDPKKSQINVLLMTHMCGVAMRNTVWAVEQQPFRLQKNKSDHQNVYTALWNSWDLMLSTRGIGWNWPPGLVVPKPAFETDSRFLFVLWSAVQVTFYTFSLDASIQIIHVLSPDTFGSLDGGSLFDHTLPPLLELLRSVFVSFLAALLAYSTMQWGYQLLAIVFVTVFQQRPSDWPPLFDSPWLSTSLTELWGRRWHQMLRGLLVPLGVRPFNYLFGRLAGPIGAFLVSGIFHEIELRSLGRGGNSVIQIGFWVMNGVGVVLEHVWRRTTGKRVGGVWGRIWMFGWLTLWGVPLVDVWAKAGRFGTVCLPGEIEPSRALVEFVRRWLVGS